MWRWLVLALAAGPVEAAELRGAVVDNQTGRPLARALVLLQPVAGTAGTVQSVRTNRYGGFEFQALAAGAYLISASRRSFAPVRYGQKRWKGSEVPVVLADTPVPNLSIRMPRFGAISGRVSDETDVGMPGVVVAIYRNTRPPQLVAKAETDDRGAYRVGALEPGSYLVRTLAVEDQDMHWIPTFAPEHPRIEGARPADVLLDRETSQINLRPIPGPLFPMFGRIRNARAGVTVTLASDTGIETTATDASGAFRFRPVYVGPYEIFAVAAEDRYNPRRAGWLAVSVDGSRSSRDFALNPLPELRFAVEDDKGRAIDLATVSIVARRKELTGEERATVLRLAEGAVTMAPGRWELSLIPGPDQYVSAFSGPGRDSYPKRRADGWNDIVLEGPALAKFVLASNAGGIHGVVARGEGVAPGAPVFLEAIDPETQRRVLDVKMTRTDVNGRYQFSGLAPGHYRVMSSYDVDGPDAAANPVSAQVSEGSDRSVDLRLFEVP